MRFHCGISFRSKLKYLKWIILVLGGLLAFFDIGNIKFANAETIRTTRETIYWQAYPISDSSNRQSASFEANQSQLYLWGPAIADYNLIRNGLLIDYNSIGGSTYQFKLRFYIASNYNYWPLDGVSCSMWASDIYNYSCSIDGYGTTTDVVESNRVTNYIDITYNFSTYGSTYIEFWINYRQPNSRYLTPRTTYFGYKRLSFEGKVDPSTIIVDQNTTIINQNNQTNENLENIENTITDETPPTIDDNTFGDIDVGTSGAVSGLITMPITLLNKLTNSLNDTCTPYTMPFGLTGGNETLTFPCIDLEDYLGSTIWNYMDLFICLFMGYEIAMLIISSFESITSLEDGFASLYTPRHARPIGKHTSEVE